MKKILSTLVLATLLVGVVAPAVASAAAPKVPDTCTLDYDLTDDIDAKCEKDKMVGDIGSGAANETENWGMCCLVNTVYSVANWIFYLMLVFVVIMVVIGGVIYMTAAGDPEKAGKGKSVIIYAIIGLAIALVAKLIPSVVKLIVGMG